MEKRMMAGPGRPDPGDPGPPGPGDGPPDPGPSGTADPSRLSARQRAAALDRMADEVFDVVVIGGGVTGCGTALDAATRGLSVALVEMTDYAAGTSSRSGKLIHGGLRYLEQRDFGLVRDALRERDLMLRRLCPHLVRPVPFIFPLTHRAWERAYVGAGIALYDALGGAKTVPRHRHLTKRGALSVAPALRADGLAGAITFHDAQVDDARHTVTLARTAAAHGAVMASAATVTGLLRDGGRVRGVHVRDTESGRDLTVRARHVISAVGVWTDGIQDMASSGGPGPGRSGTSGSGPGGLGTRGPGTSGSGTGGGFRVRASKGVHILVPRERIRSEAAILVRAEDSVLFIRPWGHRWLIGTTDTPYHHDLSAPAASREDIAYLLRNVNRIIDPPLGESDVAAVYAGLRPLLSGNTATPPGSAATPRRGATALPRNTATSRLTRDHAVVTPVPGLTVVAGGKYTTYRVMARDAVDAASRDLGREVPPSRTDEIPLLGAEGHQARRDASPPAPPSEDLPTERRERLYRRYGSLADDLLALMADHPALAEPVPGSDDYLMAEAHYAVTHEGALHLEDILARRLHVATGTPDGGARAAESVAPLAGELLGWSAATVAAEVERYRAWIAHENAGRQNAGAMRG
ncbi:MAG: glycerol-3-phosphate dehydrogenase/oxidase [Nocardiopsaceae bacterium]|nr:glycerol-3-phosphate dehydrogenase/oxidase [Nocardiopsaceae bacterium]